jgi:magnesium chelatase family protein
LFLDELPEFSRQVLETLRQPVENGTVMVSRANAHVKYPCKFMLVSAANPCRCGYLADPARACARVPQCGQDYLGRVSGPLMDRFDLRVEVPPVTMQDLAGATAKESSADIATRVLSARQIQSERYRDIADVSLNTDAEGEVLESVATPDAEGNDLLMKVTEKYRMTARGYHRVLRVARTIADLEGAEDVRRPHIAEAVSYRLISANL